MKVKRFEELEAWQMARKLVATVYEISGVQSFARDFALCNQIRRAAIAIPSNIAEGFERFRLREFHQYLSIAKGSCAEVRTQLYLAYDVGYIDESCLHQLMTQAEQVGRKIGNLRKSVQQQLRSSTIRTQDSGPRTRPCSSKT